jgi:hypothetical protein
MAHLLELRLNTFGTQVRAETSTALLRVMV